MYLHLVLFPEIRAIYISIHHHPTNPPQSSQPLSTTDPRINKLLSNLSSERKNLQGAQAYIRALQASSKNEAVIQQAHNEVRNAVANIRFLEDELAKMQIGTTSGGGGAGLGQVASPGKQSPGGQSSRSSGSIATSSTQPPYLSPSRQQPPTIGNSKSPRGWASSPYNPNAIASSTIGSSSYGQERPLPPPPPGQQAGDGTMGGGSETTLVGSGEGGFGAIGSGGVGTGKVYTQLG
jgi:hypothetical protein